MTRPARVRVVLVNFRSTHDVEARLRSDALRFAEVIVVDNGSQPEQVEQLCGKFGATALLLPANRGFAGGVNAALRHAAAGPSLPTLLLNPDAWLDAPTLEFLLDTLSRTGADGVAPLLVDPSGRPQVGAGGGPVTLVSVAAYFLGLSHLVPRWQGIFLTRRQSRTAQRVAWLCMAALLLRGDAVARFGLLPEEELVYAEDVSWGTAASRAGACFLLVPQARVVHVQGSSGASDRWVGALERLVRHRLGPRRGLLAVLMIRAGLQARQLMGPLLRRGR